MPKLLWTDLETTGLEPDRDDILEVAAYLADLSDPFKAERVGAWVIHHEAPDIVRMMNDVVLEMHTTSGLVSACQRSKTTIETVENALLHVVPYVEDKEERTILAGSTIHFDKGFVKFDMPTLFARLSHRLYDVSAVKLYCQSLGMPKIPKGEAHRAEADILESIAHAERCARWLARDWQRVRFVDLTSAPERGL